jgi:hypothetical protein
MINVALGTLDSPLITIAALNDMNSSKMSLINGISSLAELYDLQWPSNDDYYLLNLYHPLQRTLPSNVSKVYTLHITPSHQTLTFIFFISSHKQ